ncbi:MAG: aspartate aminotransferase family protein [Oscillospiraceae bacterium]|nr:aspartate aminotransferase family protein [Oscillospiraceae bacterium]
MNHEQLKALDRQYVMQTYGRFDVDIDHGKGATLWNSAGEKYIDFTAGIGVCSVGYGNESWQKAIREQAAKLGHISNLFYSEPYIKLAQRLCQRTGMANVFFANGGGEANEGMIKLARKYSFDRYGKGRGTVLTLINSFHGRTITTLAATGQDVFHNYFFPFTEGFRYAEPNLEAVQAAAGEDVCAVMVELIQGEGGVLPLDRDFVHQLAQLCRERDWLLLVDEVQTGVGRTGSLFAFQQYGVQPDVVSFAKGIAGGLPMSGVMANEKCRDVLTPGTHATTFGGNPVCAAAALTVQDIMDESFLAAVKEKGDYLRQAILGLKLPCLGEIRGMGLMMGVEVKAPYSNKDLATRLIENHLLVLTAGTALRLLPPLVITKDEMGQGVAIMKQTLEGVQP